MDPGVSNKHKGGEQSTPVPFQIVVDKNVLNNGETVRITINKKKAVFSEIPTFKGFLVQGVDQISEQVVGDFVVKSDDPYAKPMTCFGTLGSAISHKSNIEKSELTLKWKVPKFANTTCVKFYATILVEKNMFWTKKAINLIQVESSSSDPESKSKFACTDPACKNDCVLQSSAMSKYLLGNRMTWILFVWITALIV